MITRTFCTLAVVTLCPVSIAEAGIVRGVLRAPVAVAAAPSARSAYAGSVHALPDAELAATGRVTDAVISIERIPAAVDSALPPATAAPRLAQRNQSFVPHVLPVEVGTTVEFPNLDPIFHNVFSVSPGKRFDLGKYPRGQTRRVQFDRPGLVRVYCDIHSNMAAFILVLPNRAFTQPDESGAFALPALPPGDYVIHAWHPDFPALRRPIRVPEQGDLVLSLGFDTAAGTRAGVADSPAPEGER